MGDGTIGIPPGEPPLVDAREREEVAGLCAEIVRGLLQSAGDANYEVRCLVIRAIGFFSVYLQHAGEQQLFVTFRKLLSLSGQQTVPGDGPRAARRGVCPCSTQSPSQYACTHCAGESSQHVCTHRAGESSRREPSPPPRAAFPSFAPHVAPASSSSNKCSCTRLMMYDALDP